MSKLKYTKICAVCGKEYKTNYKVSVVCSEGCQKIRKKRLEAQRRNYTPLFTDPVEMKCLLCGQSFQTQRSRRCFCSKPCRDKFYTLDKNEQERRKEEHEAVIQEIVDRQTERETAFAVEPKPKPQSNKAQDVDPFAPKPRRCPGLPWKRCNKNLPPSYGRYRCQECDRAWRQRYNLPEYNESAVNDA